MTSNKINMKVSQLSFGVLLCFLFLFPPLFAQNTVLDSLQNELKIHKKRDTNRVEILINYAFYEMDFNLKEAEISLKEAEILSNKLNYPKGRAQVLYTKAWMELEKSNFLKGISYAKRAIVIYKSIGDKKGVSRCLNCIGAGYHYQSDFDRAIDYYKQSAKTDEERKDQDGIAGSYINIGNVYADQGKYAESIEYYTKAKVICEQLDDYLRIARCYNNIGSIYGEQSNFPKALENFNHALTIYNKNGDESNSAGTNVNMGVVYLHQGKFDKAQGKFTSVLAFNKKQDNKLGIANCYNKLGDLYKAQAMDEKALVYFSEALQINQAINNQAGIAISLNNLGDLQLVLKQDARALVNFQAAMAVNKGIGSNLGVCRSYLGLAKAQLSLNEPKKALENALEGQKIAEEIKVLRLQKEAAETLTSIYKIMGQFKKAFESHKEFKLLNDSLFNKENVEKMTQLEYEYMYEGQLDSANMREMNLTQTVKATNNDLEKSKQNYLWAIIITLIVTILLGGVIFYLRFRNIKSKTQNIVIEQKLLRSQMTPHFIFNSLSVLQGMILNQEGEKSVNYLSKFSRLLRIILENSRDKTVSLQQELAAIENYLSLQNLENESYAYTVQVDGTIDVEAFTIPPMLIQPFVENAIEHAFVNQDKVKKIDVYLRYVENDLICTISDNGIGIDSQKIKRNPNKKSLSTAITSERLKVLSKDFKMKGTITIEDRQKYGEQGTIVTLLIPYTQTDTH